MRRVWMIRAGADAAEIDPMRHAGLIALEYEMIGDARHLTVEEIEQALIDTGRSAGLASRRSIIVSFANEIRPGDLVVSPNPRRHEVWIGTVAGEYRYDAEPRVARHQHTRPIEWLGWLDRDAAWMKEQLKSLDRPQVLYELASREWWWRQAEDRELSLAPRLGRVTKAASPGTPRVRKPAAPKVPARKPPIPMVRCAGSCGFQWAPSSLVNGLCADCRAD